MIEVSSAVESDRQKRAKATEALVKWVAKYNEVGKPVTVLHGNVPKVNYQLKLSADVLFKKELDEEILSDLVWVADASAAIALAKKKQVPDQEMQDLKSQFEKNWQKFLRNSPNFVELYGLDKDELFTLFENVMQST